MNKKDPRFRALIFIAAAICIAAAAYLLMTMEKTYLIDLPCDGDKNSYVYKSDIYPGDACEEACIEKGRESAGFYCDSQKTACRCI